MSHGRSIRNLAATLAMSALMMATWGCSDESPTNLDAADVTLSAAEISANGQSLDGQTIQQGEYIGQVRYEAHLVDHRGSPVPGGRVQVQFGISGMMGSMHGYSGSFHCYDDGTHGDPVPGDGIYCFADSARQYGCHRAGAQPGEYRYDFRGFDAQSRESNHMNLSVMLQP